MKTLFLAVSLLALSLNAVARENVTGRVTITLMPVSARGGVVETDLRQVGDKILGNSSMIENNLINLTVSNGTYAGPTGKSLTNLKCNSDGCDGFINGFGVNLQNKPKTTKKGVAFIETSGTVNNNVYTASYNETKLKIFSWNSLSVNKIADGKYKGQASIGLGIYDVTIKTEGTMINFLADPAFVAIFLGAPISHH